MKTPSELSRVANAFSILVTGGAGFIGSAVVLRALSSPNARVLNVDKLTYASNLASLREVENAPNYEFLRADVRDRDALRTAFHRFQPDVVLHLAAESHVDRSIDAPLDFVLSNVVGTATLLEVAREYWKTLDGPRRTAFRFLYVSTDEVYGELGPIGTFNEASSLAPRSPYSASKAACDCLVAAQFWTYGLPVLIAHASNNFGARQFPEKLVPLTILNALERRPISVYGSGENVRDWICVEDCADALLTIAQKGRPGEAYNIGARNERSNIAMVRSICELVDELAPNARGRASDLIRFVADRPGNDARYAIDPTKLGSELGWRPKKGFDEALRETVRWYIENESWWRPLRKRYSGERLGRS